MKNEYEVRGDVTAIFLRQRDGTDLETLIDSADFDVVDSYQYTWGINDSGYVRINPRTAHKRRDSILLHHVIAPPPKGFMTDHINHNALDNRRANLRSVSHVLNGLNRSGPQRNSLSGIRGVHWHNRSKSWRARVTHSGERIELGHFHDVNEAKLAVEAKRAEVMAELLKDPRHVA